MINDLLIQLLYSVYGFNEFAGPPWNTSLPCPTTIVTRPGLGPFCIEHPNRANCRFPNMTITHSVLTHCPNVETLDVYIDQGGCLGPETDLWAFPFTEGDRYPPLKSLKLDGYEFGGLTVAREKEELSSELCMGPADKLAWEKGSWWVEMDEWSNKSNEKLMKRWATEGGKPKTNLDLWIEAMDWSQLEELSIDTFRTQMADAIVELPWRLTSLKRLVVDSLPFIEGLKNNTLESLRWIGTTRPRYLDAILSQQGQSLKSLTYRCNELLCPYWPDNINITTLPLLASSLEHIGINLPRNSNGTWPLAHLSAIARMPSLTSADLYFQMQAPCRENLLGPNHPNCALLDTRCYPTESFMTPYLNATTAAEMFSFLRSESPSRSLTSVTFRTGDWGEPFSSMIEPYIAHRRSAVYCSVKQGVEVCEAENEAYWQGRYGGEWEWDGEMWHVVRDFEDLLDAQDKGDVEWQERIREKMKKRIDSIIADGKTLPAQAMPLGT